MQVSIRRDSRIRAALDFLVANADRKVTVRRMADAAGLSEARFSHLFALCAGITPGKLLRMGRELRAEHQFVHGILKRRHDRI